MMKNIRTLLNNEKGNIMVLFALSITFLLGITALVIDVGRLYHEKSILQNAMDAAALAGAQGILTSEAKASNIAKEIAKENGFPIKNEHITITSHAIKVARSSVVPMTFAKVVGIDDVTVSASAKAQVSLIKSSTGVAPIAVEKKDVPNGKDLKCENTGVHHGNCGFLDINGKGAAGLKDGILNGSPIEVGNKYQETKPGENWGPVKDAIETLIDNDKYKPHCQSPDTADNSCDRVIFVVIINKWEGVKGKDEVEVIGLAAYWISHIENASKSIKGQFLKMVSPGEIGGTGVGTLYGVKLIE
ncbi:pilus assembly protein TadG-related protein [Bacillus timonensis]|nr:pilus assembly protein TadG-related protein [Bacillus timonensis]